MNSHNLLAGCKCTA